MPVSSAEILTSFEACGRRGVWSSKWQLHRKSPTEMVRRAVVSGLTTETKDPGEYAGEEVMTLATNHGFNFKGAGLYDCALNHAAIADIVTTAIRQTPDKYAVLSGVLNGWASSAMISGDRLRRFLPVSSWNADRQAHEIRSWFALGEVCRLDMPMQMIVAVMGQMNAHRRHGYWSRGLMHPQGLKQVRFRKRQRGTIEGFKETWIPVFREEHDEIERRTWLQGMFEDGVLKEALFVVEIPVPEELERQRIVELGKRKLDAIAALQELPGKQLSTCDGPLAPCPFRSCCWGEEETVPGPLVGYDAAT